MTKQNGDHNPSKARMQTGNAAQSELKTQKKALWTGEFMRFAVVGGISTVLHYGIYLLTKRWLPVNIAYTLGYVLSFIVNFCLTSYWTFHTTPSWKKLGGMMGAHGVNYLLHIFFLNLFLWVGIPENWAPIPVYMIVVPINFLLVRFVFKSGRKKTTR